MKEVLVRQRPVKCSMLIREYINNQPLRYVSITVYDRTPKEIHSALTKILGDCVRERKFKSRYPKKVTPK